MVLGGAQIKVNKISFIHRCDRYQVDYGFSVPVITLDANNKMSSVPIYQIKGGIQCDNHGYVDNKSYVSIVWNGVCYDAMCPMMPCWVFDSWPQGLQDLWRLAWGVIFHSWPFHWKSEKKKTLKNYQKRKCNLVRPNKPTGWFQGLVFHIQKSCLNFSIPISSMEKSAISLPNNGTLDVDQPILASNNLDSL